MTLRILDHAAVPLSGMNLIEASAGTGKTYAIASLYLRLLIEKGLRPEQILVVTFTEAATQELHARIRRRIREAFDVMRGEPTEDDFLANLRDRADVTGSTDHVAVLLEAALAEFDMASIFTIHGFCLRVLQDHAFESGALYDTELMDDQSALAGQVIDDFWRERFFGDANSLLAYALLKKWTPDRLMAFLQSLQLSERDVVLPIYGETEIARIENDAQAAFDEIRRIWRDESEAISTILHSDKSLSRSEKFYRDDKVEPLLPALDELVESQNPFALFDGFEKLTTSGIAAGTKKNGTSPAHPFFEACERLQSAADERLLALKSELVEFYRKRWPERKKEGNIRFFDDLLTDLYHALADGSEAEVLAEALRSRYRAALIDEFQDTDPVQYDIFRCIYANSDASLFLIGDPKQAIYSFRGADIFAYFRAASDIGEERRFTLNTNWRSVPKLLNGFNQLFDHARQPFVFDGIPSPPLVAGRVISESERTGKPPLKLCLLDGGKGDGSLKSGAATQFAAEACASIVAETISSGVDASDVAVIVRTHRQARLMQATLRAAGIVSVMRSTESVFASIEAEEVRILVTALAEPGRESLVRVALVTPLFGLNGNDIARLNEDENSWAGRLQTFRDYHQLWRERGFMVMAQELMRREGVRERLLATAGMSGERALTNVLHCFELLHREAHARGLGMESLVAWFSERVATRESGEEYQIRLENDEPAVKILTAHVSKGLQYPVVFCPFQFIGGNGSGEVVLCHDDATGRMVRDFGSPSIAHHRTVAAREMLAENLRLFYVALTRAEQRCIFFTGRIFEGNKKSKPPQLSAASYLLYASDEVRRSSDPVSEAKSTLQAIGVDEMEERLKEIANESDGAMQVRRLLFGDEFRVSVSPAGTTERLGLVLRTFERKLETDWRIASFTTLSRHKHMAFELPDRDESVPAESAVPVVLPDADRSIFSFPKGAAAGILMHSIFETLEFASASQSAIDEACVKALDRYGFDKEWHLALAGMVRQVLSTSLSSPASPFTLSNLREQSWVTELEFFFPLKCITAPELAAVLAKHGVIPPGIDPTAALQALDFAPVKGMLMGFMDMVFEVQERYYLLDWKSNHLGNSVEEYRRERLDRAMTDNLYQLQYLLYTVALDRFLALRVPDYRYETHFGGVIYVFLRGVSAERGEEFGFYRDRPSEALIRELSELLVEMPTREDEG